jgi:hypothetical protein
LDNQILVNPFLNIPRRKLDDALQDILDIQSVNGVLTPAGAALTTAFQRYYEANIPVDYWWRDLGDFNGPAILDKFYKGYIVNIKESFKEGKRACFAGSHGVGKMQDLESKLPTPDRGFIKLKDLKEGDKLFDENGNICNIVKLHPIDLNPKSYIVKFDDGEKIKVCADHLWLTWTLKDRQRNSKIKYCKFNKNNLTLPNPSVKSTQEIFETQRVNGKQKVVNHSIPVCKPLKYPKKQLPIDPYVLGCWLGDGTSNGPTITTADKEILQNIKKCGFKTHLILSSQRPNNKSSLYTIEKFSKLLKENNLLNNKHIPNIYLLGSIKQRLALIQGLLDTDGSCSKQGLIEFSNTNKNIAKSFCELVRSFGIKCNLKKNKSFLYGKRCKDRYRVTFCTKIPVFRLNRKLKNQRLIKTQEFRTTHRYIVSVKPTKPVPMRCITVDSPSHLYLVTKSCIPTHNTMVSCCILKRVVEKQYSALYVNLTDIIHIMLYSSADIKTQSKELLLNVDFLVIDEFDTRFMGNENAADLFGRILEPIMRTRIQNRMPLIFCTNSVKVEGSFSGPLEASISSLMNMVTFVPIIGGKDARKLIKSGEL